MDLTINTLEKMIKVGFLRRMLQQSWTFRITNEEVMDRIGIGNQDDDDDDVRADSSWH